MISKTPFNSLFSKAQSVGNEFFRYFGASMIALAIDAITLMFLVEVFGLHYLVAATIAFTSGALAIYLISVNWVFQHRKVESSQLEFMIFSFIGLAGLGVTIGIMSIGTGWFDLDYRISKLGAAATSFLFNYSLRKILLFSKVKENAIL